MRLKTKKAFLKSIQVFLVCLVVLGGGLMNNNKAEALTLWHHNSHSGFSDSNDIVTYCDNETAASRPAGTEFDHGSWSGGFCVWGVYYSTVFYPDYDIDVCPACTRCGADAVCGTEMCRKRIMPPAHFVNCWYRYPLPICTLTASETTINSGDPVTLIWTTTNATDADLNGDDSIALNGSLSFTPAVETTYILTANQKTSLGLINTATINRDNIIDCIACDGSTTTALARCQQEYPGSTQAEFRDCTSAGGCPGTCPAYSATGSCVYNCFSLEETITCSVTVDVFVPPLPPPPPPPPDFVEGGLVPCGRILNNPETSWDDTAPCNFCHLIMMMQRIINFLLTIMAIFALLALVVTGFLFITSAGNIEKRNQAKAGLKYSIGGVIIILTCWLIIDFFLIAWGYIDPLGGEWNVVNCDVVRALINSVF